MMTSVQRITLVPLVFTALVLSGCNSDKVVDEASVEKYNKLVVEHNAVVQKANRTRTSAWEASNKFVEYVRASESMNDSLELFAKNVMDYIDFSDASKVANYNELKGQYKTGVTKILNVQTLLIEQYNELYQLAPDVYKKDSAYLESLGMQSKRSELLSGIEAQHKALMEIVDRYYGLSGGQPKKVIVLDEVEVKVGQAPDGSGLVVDRNGSVSTLTPGAFRKKAIERGFKTRVIDDSQEMATSMNGVAGMACTNKDLVQVLNNLVSHMKTKANQNGDDLEIALAIDYSGSMGNNIKSVLSDLSSFVSSLSNVKRSGRGVKIGITTFGNKGSEAIDLDLTSNINKVQLVLTSLLDNFDNKSHSMDPGEASYYGLLKTAELNWSSKNRQTIVITDEPAYSLQVGNTNFVNSVVSQMSQINVYPLMVKLCD